MKIIRESPDELCLVEGRTYSRITFSAFALFATLLVRFAEHLPFHVQFYPSNRIFIFGCAAMAILSRTRKVRFDRSAGEVTVDWAGISFPPRTRTIPLSLIQQVELQSRPGDKSGTGLPCRVRLILKDGGAVSLTECSFIVDTKANDALVKSIRSWLEFST